MNANRPKIAPTTAIAVQAFLKPMVSGGALPKSEAQAVASILRMASKPLVEAKEGNRHKLGLLTAIQAAERLSCCPKTVHRMARDGILSRVYLRPGNSKSLRFRESEIEAITRGERTA